MTPYNSLTGLCMSLSVFFFTPTLVNMASCIEPPPPDVDVVSEFVPVDREMETGYRRAQGSDSGLALYNAIEKAHYEEFHAKLQKWHEKSNTIQSLPPSLQNSPDWGAPNFRYQSRRQLTSVLGKRSRVPLSPETNRKIFGPKNTQEEEPCPPSSLVSAIDSDPPVGRNNPTPMSPVVFSAPLPAPEPSAIPALFQRLIIHDANMASRNLSKRVVSLDSTDHLSASSQVSSQKDDIVVTGYHEQFPSDILMQSHNDSAPSISWNFMEESSRGSSQSEDFVYEDWNYGASYMPASQEPSSEDLLETLTGILLSGDQREVLCSLQHACAQVIIDYLYSVLLAPVLPKSWLRRHCLIALYKLCKASQLYPHCYVLTDLIVPGVREAFGGFSDIIKAVFGEKELCLKAVRLNRLNIEVMLKRYSKEAILWGQLNHPNIMPFYGVYYLDKICQQLCLVSPWMQHGDIVEYLQANPSTPRTPFAYDVVSGLDYLHELGLIHSDLKGANILVNDILQACITDFGMSFIRTDKTLSRALATSTIHGFTQRWAPPELLEDDARPTMASDIWSLGCVLYEILTGKLPFDSLAGDFQIVKALLQGEVPARSNELWGVWSPIRRVIQEQAEHCWTIEPGHRPKSRDVLLKLESAGLSRDIDRNAQRMAARESRLLRDTMRMEDSGWINLEVVEQVLKSVAGDHVVM